LVINTDSSAFFADVYGLREQRGCPGIVVEDLRPAIDAESSPMFVDAFHLTEEGNRRVAVAMLPRIGAALRRSEPRDHP